MTGSGISQQGWQFLLSFLLGVGLGCLYDLLRALRRKRRGLTWLLDLLFALFVLIGNFLLMLYGGRGSYRIFFLLSSAGGFCLWMLTLSRSFLHLFGSFWKLIGSIMGILLWIPKKIIEKTKIFLKKLFSNRKKSVTIKERHLRKGGRGSAQI